ncbi:LysR family transcriptional regulator, partial [Desulfovibrio sp. OttesenSCG-928-C14]|nr:LysR family transcriptional regulator [Desulfovibrio sp. OttesenSCG-928-C14]
MLEVYSGDFLSWLRSFYQLAETRSFSRTAELVGRTQSTVTYQLKRLEERLGVVLVNRKVSPLELTGEGRRLYLLCQKLFGVLQQLQSEMSVGEEAHGNVTIAANYGMTAYFLPKHLLAFKRICPKVEVEVMPLPIEGIIKAYHGPEIDFLITQQDVLPPEAQFHTLFEAEIALVTPQSWQVKVSDPPRLEDFAHYPFIAFWR